MRFHPNDESNIHQKKEENEAIKKETDSDKVAESVSWKSHYRGCQSIRRHELEG